MIATGAVFTPQIFVEIHWAYIVTLASQIFLTSLFLAGAMVLSHRSGMQILKGSSVAALSGLNREARQHMGGISEFERLQRRAKQVRVRLETAASGTALWLGLAETQPPPEEERPLKREMMKLYDQKFAFWQKR
jgi:hypothetical protein